jgi:phage terminase large subunit
MFKRTTAVNKLLALTKRKKVVQGGTSAGKTYAIIAILVDYATKNPNKKITVVAETIPAVRRGALEIFLDIMMETNRFVSERYNASDRKYKFANKSWIEFTAFDTVGKAQAAGKRTDLFINEAPYISYAIADALMIRTTENVWIDFNPTSEFWAHKQVLPQPDSEIIVLKYHDNEAISDTTVQELIWKQHLADEGDSYWQNWCRVYIDGEIGNLEGQVYTNWKLVNDDYLKDAKLELVGLDFGYTNDPTAAVAIWKKDGKYILDEIIYERQLLNSNIATKLKEYKVGNTQVVCDSSEPKSIKDLTLLGINAKGATKGAGSIQEGIAAIHEIDCFYVTERSFNLIKELRGYIWLKDKDGKATNEPIKVNDHMMDGLRYGFQQLIRPKFTGKYAVG